MQLASVEDAWEELDLYINDEMWDKFISLFYAVSYTHLDVYKRQTPYRAKDKSILLDMWTCVRNFDENMFTDYCSLSNTLYSGIVSSVLKPP